MAFDYLTDLFDTYVASPLKKNAGKAMLAGMLLAGASGLEARLPYYGPQEGASVTQSESLKYRRDTKVYTNGAQAQAVTPEAPQYVKKKKHVSAAPAPAPKPVQRTAPVHKPKPKPKPQMTHSHKPSQAPAAKPQQKPIAKPQAAPVQRPAPKPYHPTPTYRPDVPQGATVLEEHEELDYTRDLHIELGKQPKTTGTTGPVQKAAPKTLPRVEKQREYNINTQMPRYKSSCDPFSTLEAGVANMTVTYTASVKGKDLPSVTFGGQQTGVQYAYHGKNSLFKVNLTNAGLKAKDGFENTMLEGRLSESGLGLHYDASAGIFAFGGSFESKNFQSSEGFYNTGSQANSILGARFGFGSYTPCIYGAATVYVSMQQVQDRNPFNGNVAHQSSSHTERNVCLNLKGGFYGERAYIEGEANLGGKTKTATTSDGNVLKSADFNNFTFVVGYRFTNNLYGFVGAANAQNNELWTGDAKAGSAGSKVKFGLGMRW